MDYAKVVAEVAKGLNLLDKGGNLAALDSLSVLELITSIEDATMIIIPTVEIRAEVFESIESVAALLARLSTPRS